MRGWVLGGLVAVAVAAAVILGALVTGGGGLARTAVQADPMPPCPSGWFAGPRGDTCQRASEVCHTFLNGEDRRTVACQVGSPDGRGALKGTLGGSGTARVSVTGPGGEVLHEGTYDLSSGIVPLRDLRGEAGMWTLSTTFRAQGGADIYLWG